MEHVQPENVVVTQFTSIVFQNASKCTISKEKIPNFFRGRGHSPLPRPHWGEGYPLLRPHPRPRLHFSNLEPPPNHISVYGPGCSASPSSHKYKPGRAFSFVTTSFAWRHRECRERYAWSRTIESSTLPYPQDLTSRLRSPRNVSNDSSGS